MNGSISDHEMLLSNEKEQTTDTQNNLDETPGNYPEEKRKEKKRIWKQHVWIYLHNSLQMNVTSWVASPWNSFVEGLTASSSKCDCVRLDRIFK